MENPKQEAPPSENDLAPKKPHDLLFKVICKQVNLVREVIEAKAPKELLAILNLDTLAVSDASYVDERLSEDFVDVVLTCETNNQGRVVMPFILEHKSYIPAYPPKQVMRYQDHVWDWQIANKGVKLTPVIPFIFYHGEKEWPEKKWSDFLNGYEEALAPYTPTGGYILIVLSGMTDEEIERFRSGFLRTALLLMKHRFEREFLLGNLPKLLNFVEEDSEEEKLENRLRNLRYIIRYLQGLKSVQWKEVKKELNKNRFFMKAMSIDEELSLEDIEKGIEIGIEKGIEKGIEIGLEQAREEEKFFGVRNMLHLNFQQELIAGVLEVSPEFVKSVARHLPKEPRIAALLIDGKSTFAAIANKLKVPQLLVKAVKKDLDKHMKNFGNGKAH